MDNIDTATWLALLQNMQLTYAPPAAPVQCDSTSAGHTSSVRVPSSKTPSAQHTPITRFRGEHAFLSNFSPSPITTPDGRLWSTVEHAFQGLKTEIYVDQEWVRTASTAAEAKRRGRIVEMRPGWDSVRVAAMHALLELKFANAGLRKKLIDTYPRELIEQNTWGDTFWGVDELRGGQNHLGRLLMLIREQVRHG